MATELALNRNFTTLDKWTYNAPKSSGSFAFPQDVDRFSDVLWLYNPHVWSTSMHLDSGLVGHAKNACAYCAQGDKFRDPCDAGCASVFPGYWDPEPGSSRLCGLTYIHNGTGLSMQRGKLYHLTMQVERRSPINPTTPPPFNWSYIANHGPECSDDDPQCFCVLDHGNLTCAAQRTAAHELSTNTHLWTSFRNACSIIIYSPRLARLAKLAGTWDGSSGEGYEAGVDQVGWYGQIHWSQPKFMGAWTGSDWDDVGFTRTFSFDFRIPEFWWSLIDDDTGLPYLNGVSAMNFYVSVVWGAALHTESGGEAGVIASSGPPYGVDFRIKPGWSLQLLGNAPITPPTCPPDYHLSPDHTYCIEDGPPPPPPPPCPTGYYRDENGDCVPWVYGGGSTGIIDAGETIWPATGGGEVLSGGNIDVDTSVSYDIAGGGADLAAYWILSNFTEFQNFEAIGGVQVWKYGFKAAIPITDFVDDPEYSQDKLLLSTDVDPRIGKRYLSLATQVVGSSGAYEILHPGSPINTYVYLIAVDPDDPSLTARLSPENADGPAISWTQAGGPAPRDIWFDGHNIWLVWTTSISNYDYLINAVGDQCGVPNQWLEMGNPWVFGQTFRNVSRHSMVLYGSALWSLVTDVAPAAGAHLDVVTKAPICVACIPCAGADEPGKGIYLEPQIAGALMRHRTIG